MNAPSISQVLQQAAEDSDIPDDTYDDLNTTVEEDDDDYYYDDYYEEEDIADTFHDFGSEV